MLANMLHVYCSVIAKVTTGNRLSRLPHPVLNTKEERWKNKNNTLSIFNKLAQLLFHRNYQKQH